MLNDGLTTVSGLVSGLNWRDIIDELMAIETRKIDVFQSQRDNYDAKLAEWKSLNTKLLDLKSLAVNLRKESTFNIFSSSLASSSSKSPEDILKATTTNKAAQGTYNIRVLQKAQSLKLGSKLFSSRTDGLGLSGEFLVNGKAIVVTSTDTLEDIRDNINDLNTGGTPSGVTATILNSAEDEYQLILSSDETGEDGFSLLDASSGNILQDLGLSSSSVQIKNRTSDGAKSDAFTSSATAIGSLRGLSTIPASASVTIAGQAVTIDLSSESLTDIAANIDALTGVSAQVVTETDSDENTYYRLDISGTTSFTDNNNILQTLGVLTGVRSAVNEIHTGSKANTKTSAAGGGAITDSTLWSEINTGSDANDISVNDTILITGKDRDGNSVSATYTISNLSEALNATGGFLESIETAFGGSANIDAYISDGTDGNTAGQLVVKDLQSGDSLLEVNIYSNNEGGGSLDFGTVTETVSGRDMELVSGKDAIVEIDGSTYTRASNSINDLIAGATLDLVSADSSTTVTLAVTRDTDSIKAEIQGFVDAYNSIMEYIGGQLAYDAENQEPGGVLFGDGTLRSVKADLLNTVLGSISGLSSSYTSLGLAGINLQDDGTLKIDDSKLSGLLSTNFSDIVDLFAIRGVGSVSTLNFISTGRETVAGTYDVSITTAASQATVTGSVDLSGGLSGAETVTLTDTLTGRVATIALDAGDTIDDIISKINAELNAEYSQQLTASKNNTKISGGAITSTTTWDAIDTTGTGSNDISDGAVISFSGTNRRGTTIAGSYTISDKTTDTVQGLLSAIESAFNNEVYATIDTNGALVVSDRETGTSQLAFSVDSITNGGSLTFGTTSVTTTGRYDVPIEATKNSSNQLVLTHSSYGSNYGFTISQTANNLGITDQSYAGKDVAGTINGEATTGNGQTLVGNNGEANIDGLVIEYTGTATGTIGTISLTFGVMEQFERKLFGITDDFEGYVNYKMDSISDNISRIDREISQFETNLLQKQQRLISRFLAMETTIAKLSAQGAWLSSQLG